MVQRIVEVEQYAAHTTTGFHGPTLSRALKIKTLYAIVHTYMLSQRNNRVSLIWHSLPYLFIYPKYTLSGAQTLALNLQTIL